MNHSYTKSASFQCTCKMWYPKDPSSYALNWTTNFAGHTLVESESRSGRSVPYYKSVIANGGDASSGYSRGKTTYKHDPISWKGYMLVGGVNPAYWSMSGYYADSDICQAPSYESISVANGNALTAFWGSYSPPIQGGVIIGELRETLRMLKSPAKALFDVIRESRKTLRTVAQRNRHSKFLARSLSDAWLEAHFGWAPLISDTLDVANEIDRITNNISGVRTRSSGESEKVDRVTSTSAGGDGIVPYHGPLFRCQVSRQYVQRTRVSYTVGESFKVDSCFDASGLASVCGLDLRNFLPTVWELTPWSFAVDYFTNVGEMVNAAGGLSKNVRYVSRSIRQETKRAYCVTYDSAAANSYMRNTLGLRGSVPSGTAVSKGELFTYNRSAVGPSIPPLQLNLIPSTGQIYNLIALGLNRV